LPNTFNGADRDATFLNPFDKPPVIDGHASEGRFGDVRLTTEIPDIGEQFGDHGHDAMDNWIYPTRQEDLAKSLLGCAKIGFIPADGATVETAA
jgi:hypothetical protein